MASGSYTFAYTNNSISLTEGEALVFKLQISNPSTNNFTASIGQGSLQISSLAPATGYATAYCPYFDSGSISSPSASASEIVFTEGLSSFYNTGYTFVPNPVTGSAVNSLYDNYGDVSYPFVAKPYDIVLIYLSDNTYIEARILEIYLDNNNLLHFALDTQLSQLAKTDLANGTYKTFLLLTRLEDETNTYLVYKKRSGQTSYGFIIPNNLAPDVLANIDTITSQVKQKLVNDQGTVIGSVDGGDF